MGHDLDYLTARFHGRRGRMAEADRLTTLCRLPTLGALSASVLPGPVAVAPSELQRGLTADLIAELHACLHVLPVAAAALLRWFLVRYQIENIKIALRGSMAGRLTDAARYRYRLPSDIAAELPLPAKAETTEDILDALTRTPAGPSLIETRSLRQTEPRLFLAEAVIDRAYHVELLARARRLPDDASPIVMPIFLQEADTFHLQLALRGRLAYGLNPDSLLALHVPGTLIPRQRLRDMLAAASAQAIAALVFARAVDTRPGDRSGPATVEALARNRYLRLANRAFRQDPIGLGAVIGYAALRFVEVANLTTVSEGVHTGVPEAAIRAHLLPLSPANSHA